MRKTHRRKKWIVVALILWGLAYSASVTPRVQSRGWGAAIPRVAIVAALPFLSEEQGTSDTSIFWRTPKSLKLSTKFNQLVHKEVPRFGYYPGTQTKKSEFGWFSRRLAFLLGRFESESILTDGTTAKGSAYQGILSTLVNAHQAYGFESNWAKQIITIDIQIDRPFGPQEPVYGIVRVRRMFAGRYRISFGPNNSTYRCSTGRGFRGNGRMPLFDTPEEERAFWVNQFLWDDMSLLDATYGRNSHDRFHPLGQGQVLTKDTAILNLHIRVSKYTGDKPNGYGDDANWTHDFVRKESIHYQIDQARTIVADQSEKLRKEIEQSTKAMFTVEYDRGKQKWVPVLKIESNGQAPKDQDTILFGGRIEILEVPRNDPAAHGTQYFSSTWNSWWQWGTEPYEQSRFTPTGDQDSPFIESTETRSRPLFKGKSGIGTALAGELRFNEYAIYRTPQQNSKLVVRLEYTHHPAANPGFGGLWGNRVYEGTLQYDLKNWTIQQLKRYIVNGTVPDHAMP